MNLTLSNSVKMSRSKGNPAIPVKNVMTSPVVTVIEDENVKQVAKLIVERDIGSIVVIDHQGNPLGVSARAVRHASQC